MDKKRNQFSIKLKEKTKKKLDVNKKYEMQTYDEVITDLLSNQGFFNLDLNHVDEDWQETKQQVDYYQCPHCKKTQLSLMLTPLHSALSNYILYDEDKTRLIALFNFLMKNDDLKIESPEAFLDYLKKINKIPKSRKDRIAYEINGNKQLKYAELDNVNLGHCFNCQAVLPRKFWELKKRSERVLVCPICSCEVIDDPYNRTGNGTLACPSNHYYFDRNWEIFNQIKMQAPTIDHLRYDSKKEEFRIYPYHCDSDYLLKLLTVAKKLNYSIGISGSSEYHPNTLRISLKRQK